MSLFDLIRYPISMPPTSKELENLPTLLYNEWAVEVHKELNAPDWASDFSRFQTAIFLQTIFGNKSHSRHKRTVSLVEDLRQKILDI